MIKYTFDIETQQPVYVVCDAITHQAQVITTNIMIAINKLQEAK